MAWNWGVGKSDGIFLARVSLGLPAITKSLVDVTEVVNVTLIVYGHVYVKRRQPRPSDLALPQKGDGSAEILTEINRGLPFTAKPGTSRTSCD